MLPGIGGNGKVAILGTEEGFGLTDFEGGAIPGGDVSTDADIVTVTGDGQGNFLGKNLTILPLGDRLPLPRFVAIEVGENIFF